MSVGDWVAVGGVVWSTAMMLLCRVLYVRTKREVERSGRSRGALVETAREALVETEKARALLDEPGAKRCR